MKKTTLLFCFLIMLLFNKTEAQTTYSKHIRSGNSIYVYDVVATKSLRSTIVATNDPSSGNNFFLTKLDEKGKVLWSKTFVYPGAFGIKMAAANNEATVCIANVSNEAKRNGNLLFKIDSSGDIIWAERIKAKFEGWFSNNGVVCTNDETIYSLNFVPTGQSIQQFTNDGELVWTKYLYQNNAPLYGQSFFAAATNDNGLIFSNETGGLNLFYDQLYKVSKSGKAEWTYRTDEATNYYVYTQAANTRADGKVELLFFRYEYFVYTILNPNTGLSKSYNLGNILSMQAYLRKHNINGFKGVTFPFVNYTNDLHVFTKNFGLTNVVQEYPENYRYIATINKYDSIGRICPNYKLPETKNPDTINFRFSGSSFSTENSSMTYKIEDAVIKVKDFIRLNTDCEGVAENSQTADFAKIEQADQPFTIFPNPVKNSATIKLNTSSAGLVHVYVINQQGMTVKTVAQNILKGNNNISINIAGLHTGSYITKICLPEGNYTQKIRKE